MIIAKLQAAYYVATGVWAILHLRSFEAITGSKTDKWLVKSMAWLFVVIGLQLWTSGRAAEVAVLGIGVPIVIAGADIYYSLVRRRISRVYLLDAALEVIFVVGWLVHLLF